MSQSSGAPAVVANQYLIRYYAGTPPLQVISDLYGRTYAFSRGEQDPPLTISDVLKVMDWLFEEVITGTVGKNSLKDRCYLTRLHAVDAQQTAVLKLKNTKHRPYDMLAAIFLAASAMPATEQQKAKLRHYRNMFMHMYLTTSANFDYQSKDIYQHLPHAQLMQRKEQLERIAQLSEIMKKIQEIHNRFS